jgi:thymidylate kinase
MTESGKEIARLIRQRDVSAKEAAELYVQDRKEHTVFIKDILNHSHILTSRYDVSTLIYQMTQGMSFEELYEMHNYEKEECISPDFTIIFELDADIAFKRTQNRNSVQECFEKIEFQRKLVDIQKEVIKRLEEKGRKIIIVNANQSIKEVTTQMLEKLNNSIKNS